VDELKHITCADDEWTRNNDNTSKHLDQVNLAAIEAGGGDSQSYAQAPVESSLYDTKDEILLRSCAEQAVDFSKVFQYAQRNLAYQTFVEIQNAFNVIKERSEKKGLGSFEIVNVVNHLEYPENDGYRYLGIHLEMKDSSRMICELRLTILGLDMVKRSLSELLTQVNGQIYLEKMQMQNNN